MHLMDFYDQICFTLKGGKAAIDSNLVTVDFSAHWDLLKVRNGYPVDTINFNSRKVKTL